MAWNFGAKFSLVGEKVMGLYVYETFDCFGVEASFYSNVVVFASKTATQVLGLWIVTQVPIRFTIHELQFTDGTASHWLIKK